jgi:hypothetical protein
MRDAPSMNLTTNGHAAGRIHHGQHHHYPLTVKDLSNLSILGSISVYWQHFT